MTLEKNILEAEWLVEARKSALEKFQESRLSEKEEPWRYTHIDGFDFTGRLSSSGSLSFKGKFVTSLKDALKSELIKNMLAQPKPGSDKIDFFNEAFWTDGYYVNVPDNTDAGVIEISIASGITRNIVILGRNSTAELVENIHSGSGLNANSLEIRSGENSKANVYSFHNVSDDVEDFSYKRAFIGKNSSLNWNIGQFGGKLSRIKVDNHFAAEGANSAVIALFAGSGNQHLDLSTNAFHTVPNTSNIITVKGALKDNASQVYRGMIKIEKTAPQTSSRLSDHAILLSENAVANSIPSLKIDNNDVRCSHSASVGQVDEEKMLYLMSRGLPRKHAESLIVEGFYSPILNAIPSERVRQQMIETIRKKML